MDETSRNQTASKKTVSWHPDTLLQEAKEDISGNPYQLLELLSNVNHAQVRELLTDNNNLVIKKVLKYAAQQAISGEYIQNKDSFIRTFEILVEVAELETSNMVAKYRSTLRKGGEQLVQDIVALLEKGVIFRRAIERPRTDYVETVRTKSLYTHGKALETLTDSEECNIEAKAPTPSIGEKGSSFSALVARSKETGNSFSR